MRVFIAACFAVILVAVGSAAILDNFVQQSAAAAFTVNERSGAEPAAHLAASSGPTKKYRAKPSKQADRAQYPVTAGLPNR